MAFSWSPAYRSRPPTSTTAEWPPWRNHATVPWEAGPTLTAAGAACGVTGARTAEGRQLRAPLDKHTSSGPAALAFETPPPACTAGVCAWCWGGRSCLIPFPALQAQQDASPSSQRLLFQEQVPKARERGQQPPRPRSHRAPQRVLGEGAGQASCTASSPHRLGGASGLQCFVRTGASSKIKFLSLCKSPTARSGPATHQAESCDKLSPGGGAQDPGRDRWTWWGLHTEVGFALTPARDAG